MKRKFRPSRIQREIIDHRGAHLQVIACAGSGKTESVARRIAALVAGGELPDSIVAFTFTERAAEELKSRILARVVEEMGVGFRGKLAQMFVGTIHSYCFQMLQNHVPQYGNYDVLDPNRHAGFLSREYRRLDIKNCLGVSGHWQPIRDFSATVDVIGNELITIEQLEGTPLADVYQRYLDALDRYHYLTFSLIIQKAVQALTDEKVFRAVHGQLRHLIVDEYQDINPAQEELIRRLAEPPVQLCVVGDDDQSIYQWRGSDVSNIVAFRERYQATTKKLMWNRRSVPGIVDLAAGFAETIEGRLRKKMRPKRAPQHPDVVPWSAASPVDEASVIADTVLQMHDKGYHYRDIAVLFRSVRGSAPPLIDALRERKIPYRCGGRTGLFLQPEIDWLARAYHWLADFDWRPQGYGQEAAPVDQKDLVAEAMALFAPARGDREIRQYFDDWKSLIATDKKPANLVGDLYRLLHFLGVDEWDVDDSVQSSRLGALARFSTILADYENVTRRGRFQIEKGQRTFHGGQNRGDWYYKRLAGFIQHYARDAYEELEGEEVNQEDAVDILTVHAAKGLEWPVVFLPALTNRRFPSSLAGREREWLLPDDVFCKSARLRYQGGVNEERRLFYVAVTRARDVLYLSHFRHQTNRAKPSQFLVDLYGSDEPLEDRSELPIPPHVPSPSQGELPAISVSFSDLASFSECGFRYRLATNLGFQTQLVSELGYGKAVHHVLRQLADITRVSGKLPTPDEARLLYDSEFYLPFANAFNFPNMHRRGWMLVEKYLRAYKGDLQRVWATERPFELHLEEGLVTGRADVILSHHKGNPDSLAIVDYKTMKGGQRDDVFQLQLRVYAAAGQDEGLTVEAAYLHHLADESSVARTEVPVTGTKLGEARDQVAEQVRRLRDGTFQPAPHVKRCKTCEYQRLCRHAPGDTWDEV